ncbi:hypothetical protein EV385_2337 [Krasilnikovia cinnamomea]|uniref:Uncharacterized protein n=1 Tax=Krasilnikovia cinnamomea TaxID=349313 RepID=A0A4Q7ZI94_9ACTN|nr:hypothetical protein [Krasilnikovia cinnamomea]RZU50562.1 hypothetical protein EV385_2337 [Krasilnikovia cinnamomea]
MRRALLAVTLGGALLTTAACDDAETATPTAAGTSVPPSAAAPATTAANYAANTKKVCGQVETIFTADLKNFGTELGRMIAFREAKQAEPAAKAEKAARAELKKVAEKIRKQTATAQDPELRKAGAESAAKFSKSAQDTALLSKIKTTKDLDKSLEGLMATWLTPVAGVCG